MNNSTIAEALLLDPSSATPQQAGSALEQSLTAIDMLGTLLQGRAEPLTPEQLEVVGQLIKETAMLGLCAYMRQGKISV
ncbi:hypothetical protein ACFO3I_04875 [Rheinheimera marina]|uniref:Uncharacterized protein n=1 Tax=Rheinheimera marina TaxID=1774958 RepID=A0ABV9JI42_9GAMM